MEYFVISAKFVPLKYYTLSSQLQRLTSFSVGCSGRRILSPGQIAVMRKWSIMAYSRRRCGHIQLSMFRATSLKTRHNSDESVIFQRDEPCINRKNRPYTSYVFSVDLDTIYEFKTHV